MHDDPAMTQVDPDEMKAIEEHPEDWDELEGQTRCPEGCYVEPDGQCPHGYEALALRMVKFLL